MTLTVLYSSRRVALHGGGVTAVSSRGEPPRRLAVLIMGLLSTGLLAWQAPAFAATIQGTKATMS